MYWDKNHECMDREELSLLQLRRLKRTVERAYHNVAPYRQAMQAKGMQPEDVKSLDDLKHLPFTTKQDLRDSYPYDRFRLFP